MREVALTVSLNINVSVLSVRFIENDSSDGEVWSSKNWFAC